MQEVFSQITELFSKLSRSQKGGLIAAVCTLGVIIWMNYPMYTPICSSDYSTENGEIRHRLDRLSIPYKEKQGQLWVPKKQLRQAHSETLDQAEVSKGFELFDTNTWIKSEKELQILEMRALKGQLERELLEFEQIKHASVILDLAFPRSFGSPVDPTKASVILALKPNSRLSHSQLRAITHHLTGAIRGLEPHRVAISDTKGRLYQTISSTEGSDQEAIIQAEMQEYVEQMIEKICGIDNMSIIWRRGSPMAVDILVNQSAVGEEILSEMVQKIVKVGKRYGTTLAVSLDAVPFASSPASAVYPQRRGSVGIIFYILMVGCAIIVLFSLTRTMRKKTKEQEKDGSTTRVDFQILATSLKGEDPKTLALMFSYLEAQRAEEILSAFPRDLQEAILAEMEEVP